MECKNLILLFDKFKDVDNTIDHSSFKKMMNILSLDIEKLDVKNKYTFDDFYLCITQSVNNTSIKISKKDLVNRLKKEFDKDTINFVINDIFSNENEIDINNVTI